jgi:hypothetical protein
MSNPGKPPERRVFDVCRTFSEIQAGPNPLTPEEVRKLIDKRPEVYGVLEAWAAQSPERR